LKKVVARERNKTYYRILHMPIWIWVFFVLPGHLTHDLYLYGPDHRHRYWLLAVVAVVIWRGYAGRLPGVEFRPYVTHYGMEEPNLRYRVVCYTAAWIDLLVPFALNLAGLAIAVATGRWMMQELYDWLYYPLAGAIALATAADWTPRAKRSVKFEGVERAWFYVAIWTVVPSQAAGWAMWRLGRFFALDRATLNQARLGMFVAVAAMFFALAALGKLPRTRRDYEMGEEVSGGV
jgi:hypothetical protein